uniref:Uncharacterized protein n=2 Tax=Sinocyclocheilus grahami TaxID=75366 RepID=A0A672NV38_SINGR
MLRSCEVCEDASGLSDKSPSTCEGPVQRDTGCPEEHRSGILRELRGIQVIEEQIMQECVKLEALRCRETESLGSEELALDQVRERSVFLQQMERSLGRETERAGKAKRRSSKGRRVVTCSVMTLKDLDDELLRSCGLQSPPDAEETSSDLVSNAEECTSPSPAGDADLTDSSLTSEPASTASLGRLDSESLQSRHSEPVASSGLSETGKLEVIPPSADVFAEHSEEEASSCDSADLLETGEACSTRDGGDVRGAFDPGGVSESVDHACGREERRPSDCVARVGSGLSVVPSKLMQNNNNNTAVLCSVESPGRSEDSRSAVCDGGGSTRAACGSTLQQLQLHTSSRQMSDYKTPIVLDTGSGLIKAGFADQDLPTTVFPTVIGRPKYEVHPLSCFT